MYNAIDIAKYIIEYSIKNQNPVSNLKLQKLLYYIQAAFLVEFNTRCFQEPILAWAYGPVVREVYDEFKIYGRENIPCQEQSQSMNFDYSKIRIVFQKEKLDLNNDEKKLINKVVASYAQITNPFELVEKTHSENPWKDTASGCEITVDSIKEYYLINREKIYNS